MSEYILSCCSTADLSKEYFESRNIHYICFHYMLGDKSYPDDLGQSVPFDEFYARMAAGEMTKTSQVNVDEFAAYFEGFLKEGKDILHVSLSSGLSGSVNSARIAAEDLKSEYPDAKILVIDSLSASRGQGMLLYRTVQERRRSSPDIETLAAYVRSILQTQCHWFIVDDLNHLKRGGRVSATAAFVGTMLGIKPVMHTDSEGRLIPMSKARGTKAALKALVDKVEELGVEPDKNQPLFICHANCPDSVAYVKELLEERFGVTDVRADFIGPVIGAHTGCGTLGLFFVGTQR